MAKIYWLFIAFYYLCGQIRSNVLNIKYFKKNSTTYVVNQFIYW
jgi:glycerol-3-phosphate acyltransferase PlsY